MPARPAHPAPPASPDIPELGPLLGRLAVPQGAASGLVPLDDIRLRLVSEVFELAGAAREFAEGDAASAVQSLSRHGWLAAWERAVDAAAQRIAERIEARLRSAAAESRLPEKRLARRLLSKDERRGISVRIGTGGAALVEALDAMETTARKAARSAAEAEDWRAAITGVARRLESAWTALEGAAAREEASWQEDIAEVRAWRRPRWPLWIISLGVATSAAYVALVLGGFLTAPGFLRPLAEWWWGRG